MEKIDSGYCRIDFTILHQEQTFHLSALKFLVDAKGKTKLWKNFTNF